MRLGNAASGHSAFPARSTGSERELSRFHVLLRRMSPQLAVRPEGANHQWRKNPPRELSIDLVADERLDRVTGRAEAS